MARLQECFCSDEEQMQHFTCFSHLKQLDNSNIISKKGRSVL